MNNSVKYKVITLPTNDRAVVVEMAVGIAQFTMQGNASVMMPCGTKSNEVLTKVHDLLAVDSEDTKKLLDKLKYPDVSSLLHDFKVQGAEIESVGFPRSEDAFDIKRSWILNVVENGSR